MTTYILRRLMLMVPTLLGVLAVVFFVMAAAPGGVGGSGLDLEGAQNQDEDAKRVQRQMQRRYGTDLPAYQQFFRWMNQVSPVGFRMSAQVRAGYGDADRAEAAAALSGLALAERDRDLGAAVDLALEFAAYRDQTPGEAAGELAGVLGSASSAVSALHWVDSTLSPGDRERLLAGLTQSYANGLRNGQLAAVRELSFEAAGASRVRFDRPAVKMPDLGETLKGRSVVDRLSEALPISILLNLLTIPLIYLVAIVTGVYAARRAGGAFDLSSGVVLITLWCLPTIWVGQLMLQYLASAQQPWGQLFPTGGLHSLRAEELPFLPRWGGEDGFEAGWLLDSLWHLALPVVCLTYGGFAVASRVMRGSVLDALSADYVRTARAKGVHPRVVLWSHVFRNSLLPLITMAASILPALFAGTVIVETIFSINGMGKLAVDAAFAKDRELMMAVTLLGGILGLISELIRDVCYAIADPRVSYD
ncbi:MAG: ABC transporter permease [Planctomycetota bacterium]